MRLALEERASFSPDALTGMEANLRFGGPETLESKIFGRLSAWQNWIFQRPNASGGQGALQAYGHRGAGGVRPAAGVRFDAKTQRRKDCMIIRGECLKVAKGKVKDGRRSGSDFNRTLLTSSGRRGY